jgi:putative lipoprotein
VWNITPDDIQVRQVINTQDTWPKPEEDRKDGTLGKSCGMSGWLREGEVKFEGIDEYSYVPTRKLCPDPIMDQENKYLAALESAATYQIEGNTMNMWTAEGATAANFQRSSGQKESASVWGSVTNVESAPIPEGAILTVQIQDTSLQDVAATVIGEQIVENPGQFPIPYEVGYDPGDIKSPTYTMSARITGADGSLLFINDTSIPVITGGNPTDDVEIPVIQVGG